MKKLLSMLLVLATLVCCAIPAFAGTNSVTSNGMVGIQDTDAGGHVKFIYYPQELETSDKTYPVIIWANGTGCIPAMYIQLFRGLVKEGFVVVASSDVMSADGTEQIACVDYIFDKAMDETSPLFGKLDPQKIVAMGHSQGGRSTVNAAAADGRFCCAVSIAGSNYKDEAARNSTPTLFITGTLDAVVASALWVKPAYKAATGPAVYASVRNAVHTTCMLEPGQYVKYAALWIRAWAEGDKTAKAAFQKGGALSKDGEWKDFDCKNMSGSLAGSAFTDGSTWSILAIGEAIVIMGLAAMLAKKKKEDHVQS